MGDARRFNKFADRIAAKIKGDISIADLAGGKGFLQLALRERGLTDVETWDKRAKHIGGKRRYDFFDWKTAPNYQAVVGLHCDEATDHAILYAAKHGIPAFICPCCAKGSAVAYWGKNSYKHWVDHLLKLADERGLQYHHESMKFNGRDDFFLFTPKSTHQGPRKEFISQK